MIEQGPRYDIGPDSFQEQKLTQLSRLIVLQKHLEAILTAANLEESPGQQDWNDAVEFTRRIIGVGILSTYTDLLDNGDEEMVETAQDTVGRIQTIPPEYAAQFFLDEPPAQTFKEVTIFVQDVRALDYQNKFIPPSISNKPQYPPYPD